MAMALATTVVAQRPKQYGMELANDLVTFDYRAYNRRRRRLELSMTLAGSEEHIRNIVRVWAPQSEETAVGVRSLGKAVGANDYAFLNEAYGAETRKQFKSQLKLLQQVLPAINTAVLGGAGATHLNEQQIRGLVRQSLVRPAYEYIVASELFSKSRMEKSQISVKFKFDSDPRYMMGLQASGFEGDCVFPLNYTSKGADSLPELAEYEGYYCKEDKPLSLAAGQIPYFVSFTDAVTLPKDGHLFDYKGKGRGGFVEFPKDVPIVLYDLKRGVVYTRASPFLVPETVWQNHTPEQIGNRTYLQYLSGQDHLSEHDRALTKYIAARDDIDTARILAAPFRSLVRVGSNAEMAKSLSRILAGCYENNPMYATCDHLYEVAPTMFPRDLLPGMLVRADMIGKASDVNSGQGTLMCISQPASPGAIGIFFSGYDDKLHVHTMDIGIIATALESTFEPCDALDDAEIVGSVSIFSHAEHERMLMFFTGHRPDIYSKMAVDELWGDTGDHEDYADWCGDLERLFVSLVSVYSKLYDDDVGNTIHSLGMVYTEKKGASYNVLDAPTMMQEIHLSDAHRGFLKSQEFVTLGGLVFGEYFEELLQCRMLGQEPDSNMALKNISKFTSVYFQLSSKFLMRTKAAARKPWGSAPASSSSSSSATVVAVKPVAPRITTMPNFEQDLAKLKQELRDLTASPPPMGPTPEEIAAFRREHEEAVDGANKMYEDWFASFKKDFKEKNTGLREALEAAILNDEVDTDEEERIEAELKKLCTDAKAAKLAKKAETDAAIKLIEADLELKLNSKLSFHAVAALKAHNAEVAAKSKEIEETKARLYDIKRQELRSEYRSELSAVAQDLKKTLGKLREFQDRAGDDKDVIMDDGTFAVLQKYAATTALQVQAALLATKSFPGIKSKLFASAKPSAAPMEIVDIADDDEGKEEEMDEGGPPPVPPKVCGGGKKRKKRAASNGAAAAVVAASPASRASSSSSSKRRAISGGGRKPKAFSSSSSSSSSSSGSSAAAASSSDRQRAASTTSMGSLPNMDVCGDNIIAGRRTRSRTIRYTHPDEWKVCKAFYRDEEMDEEMELAGEVFKPINEDCAESGEEESDGESDEELLSFVGDDEEDDEAAQSAPYVPPGSSSESESESESESDFSDDEGY